MNSMSLWPWLKNFVFAGCVAFIPQCTFAQFPTNDFRNAVSSDAFLNGLPPASLEESVSKTEFPAIAKDVRLAERSNTAIPVGYTTEPALPRPQMVSTAQFETPAVSNTIGTGVPNPNQSNFPATSDANQPAATISPSSSAQVGEANRSDWRDRFGFDRELPNFQAGFEVLGFRRSNDSVGPYSQDQSLSRFDQDIAGRYSFSRLLGGIERIEFQFTGPFHWEKSSSTVGPVDSNFPSSIATTFDQADKHEISHQIRLSSYELNRCWSSDELSTFFYGMRIFDHAERYQLNSTQGVDKSSLQLGTNNFLAGGQIGLNLSRPISQRMTAGLAGGIGLYGNFASGSLSAFDGQTTLLDTSDKKLRLNSTLTTGGRINYRLSQNIIASAAYEYWYFPGLATAAHQPLSSDAQLASLALRTDDDQLFRGWSFGLSARF